MMSALFSSLFLAAISLLGVTGERLTARAHFDANNVRLGDPMILMIDFVGNAEFEKLHPPPLSRAVDRTVWKVDDASAKTDTYRTARRLIYRVRPLKEGVLTFPSLSFSYALASAGTNVVVATSPVPVHVKPGTQAALVGLDADLESLPMPDGIHVALATDPGDETRFRWEKACRAPTAVAFAAFDFPEARLNEAACHILEGNWAKAMRLYARLEWRLGQTPEIERGIVAALARKEGSAAVELPVWRTAFRPVLRFAWQGRVLVLALALTALTLVFWLCGRLIRLFVCLGAILVFSSAEAQQSLDPFAEMEQMMERMRQNMQTTMGGFSFNGARQPRVKITARLETNKSEIRVGDAFEFIVSLESPKSTTLEQIRLTPSERFGMTVTGQVENLADGKTENPSNVVRRLAIPVRYDVPFKGAVSFRIDGMASGRQELGGAQSRRSFSFSQSFAAATPPVRLDVKPLPTDGQPADFLGAVGTDFTLRQTIDRTRVETNDVVIVTCVLDYRGYVPIEAVPNALELDEKRAVWQSYFIADGAPHVPPVEFVYYDAAKKSYERVTAKGPKLSYVTRAREDVAETVAVDALATRAGELLKLRFAPSASAPLVGTVPKPLTPPTPCETCGAWSRIITPTHAGWVRTEELK